MPFERTLAQASLAAASFTRLALALLGCAHGLARADVPEGPEPNDRLAQPTLFACANRGNGVIAPAFDRDAWTFTLAQPSDLTAFTSALSASPLPDSVLALYDAASGAQLAWNDDYPGRGLYSQIDAVALPAGTYLLEVSGYTNSIGGYALDLVCRGTLAQIQEGPEPNASTSSATPLGCDARGAGTIPTADDRDWWSVVIAQRLVLEAGTAPHGASPVNDTALRLFDASGARLAFDDDTGPGLYSRFELALAPGVYFLEVSGFGGAVGGYLLETRCRPVLTAPCGSGIGDTLSGFDERDFFEITLGGESDLEVLARALGAGLDLRCEVRDERGRLLGRSREDRVLGTRDARFLYRGAPAGRYLVGVDAENGGTGSYDLLATCQPASPRLLALDGTPRSGTSSGGGQAELERTTILLAAPSELALELDTPSVNGELLELALYDRAMRRDDDVGLGLPRMLYPGSSCASANGLPTLRLGLPAGTFHVVVRGNPDAAPCSSSPASYQLRASATPLVLRELSPGDASLVLVTRPGQSDLFRYSLGTPSEMAFRAVTPFSSIDTTLFLWSAQGELLAKDDDGGGNLESLIATRPWPRGDYVLAHRPFSESATTVGPVELFLDAPNEIVGPPPIPTTLDLRWRGSAGASLLAWISALPADLPLGAPLDGQYLLLDPLSLLPLVETTIGASGMHVLAGLPVVDPSLIGTSLYTQALITPLGGAPRLTNRDAILFR